MPAIDLREGACVQLVGGAYADERLRLPDPVAVARRWAACGFRRLHVVDLDAATGRGANAAAVDALLAESGLRVQVGGGVRHDVRIAGLLGGGADRVVVGTRAVTDAAWLSRAADGFPGRIIVAADVDGSDVMIQGWQTRTARDVRAVLRDCAALPLAGILVTAVHREGRLQGPDLDTMADLAGGPLPLFASGGITTMDDLRALAALGVSAAILGMALYTGVLEPRAVAEEFGT